jgi:hypothetical protein
MRYMNNIAFQASKVQHKSYLGQQIKSPHHVRGPITISVREM